MVRRTRALTIVLVTLLLAACEFQEQADQKFGDQHFKTAIALIELHKVRTGSYPKNLGELRFTGDWDQIAIASVSYDRLDDGYTLQITRGWVGKPQLVFPPEFYAGLGLRRPSFAPKAIANATPDKSKDVE